MAMWCPKCETKSPALAVGHDELICAECNSEVVAHVPRPKSSRKRKSTAAYSLVTKEEPDPSKTPSRRNHPPTQRSPKQNKPAKRPSPEVEFIERLPQQSKPLIKPKTKAKPNPATKSRSTKSVPATTTPTSGTEKKWRSDGAHVIGNTGSNLQTNVEPRTQNSSKKAKRPASPTGRKPSKYLMIQIGLLIYLFGHGLTVWAFLAGNFGAWTVGSFCSVGGVTIAIVSVVHALRQNESQPHRRIPRRRRT